MNKSLSCLAVLAGAALLSGACGFEHKTTNLLEPTPVTSGSGSNNASTPSLVGTWSSPPTASLPSPSSCGNFQYQVTSQTATSISGSFTAICGGGLAISGTANGQLNGNAIAITVNGSGTMPGVPSCNFTLNGNGTIEDNGNTLQIPYTGTTCLGPVSGTGVLHRPQSSAPAAVINAPTTVSPAPNEHLTGIRTTLVVNDATTSGPVGALDYQFELANDEAFTNRVGSWNVHGQPNQTSLDLPIDLAYASVYYWHARAFDGQTTGDWSITHAFATPNPPASGGGGGGDPTFGCPTGNHEVLVQCIHDHVNPAHTVEAAFDVTKRVAWALRGEGAGLLIKNGGENIISWHGYSFAAGRICYPDGHIFKVLSDVPGTNGASWQDNGFVDRSLYVPAIDPNQ